MVRMPSPEQQAKFFANLQRLLTEGEFVSTYKFALLLSLTRWAVEHPDHDGSNPVDVGELAQYFVELYWSQVRRFGSRSELAVAEFQPGFGTRDPEWQGVLIQDRGKQIPRVFKLIAEEHQHGHARFTDVPVMRRRRLLREVRATIREMPLWKLQNVGTTSSWHFLYHRGEDDNSICFEPGIIECLANFALLIEDTVRAAWLRFVLRCNPLLLGSACQVEAFLFPGGRSSLADWRRVLEETQGSACFYCNREFTDAPEVDHFLPWSHYPRDLGHNFVLADATCNGCKSDYLPSCEHLERWCRRNEEQGVELARRFDDAGLPHDWPTLRNAACTLYQITANVGGDVWRRRDEFVRLTDEWRGILGCA